MRILLLLGLLVLSAGSSCLDSQTVLPGQLGQITDAATMPCKPYPETEGTHQCLLIANPYQRGVRVFDATTNQFVLSPIGYFPLAIVGGRAPNRLASFDGRAFILDPLSNAIYEVTQSFISPLAQSKALNFTPNQFVIAPDGASKPWALVSGAGSQIHVIPLGQGTEFTFDMAVPVNLIEMDVGAQTFFVASGVNLYQFKLADIFAAKSNVAIPAPQTQSSAILAIGAGSGQVFLSLAEKKLVTLSGADFALDAPAQVIYLPESLPGAPNPCCNGATQWLAILQNNGTLQYISFAKNAFGAVQKLNIPTESGISSYALTGPVRIVGANAQGHGNDGLGCDRRLFLVYSGSIFNTCEGSGAVKRLDQMEY